MLLLENYYRHPNGVIRQGHVEPFTYDADYLKTYEAYPTDEMAKLRLAHIRRFVEPKSILDIGYGDGAFLRHCVEEGIESYGYDVTGVSVPDGATQVADMTKPVEVATFFDALEHMEDIEGAVASVNADWIVITVPCLKEGFDLDWWYSWKHRKPNEHIWHFSPRSLAVFMYDMGYFGQGIANVEDQIRQTNFDERGHWNTMTGIFKKSNGCIRRSGS